MIKKVVLLALMFNIFFSCSTSKKYNEHKDVSVSNTSQLDIMIDSLYQLKKSSDSTSILLKDVTISHKTEEEGRWYDKNNNLDFEGKKTTTTSLTDKTNAQTTINHSADSVSNLSSHISLSRDSLLLDKTSVKAETVASASTASFYFGFIVAVVIVVSVIALFFIF